MIRKPRDGKEVGLARTLGQLIQSKMALVAVCKNCKRQRTLLPRSLAERYGLEIYSVELQGKLRCSACGELGAKVYECAR